MARFPVLGVLLLIVGVVWLLSSLGYFIIDFPFFPIVLIVVAVGMIWNRFCCQNSKRK